MIAQRIKNLFGASKAKPGSARNDFFASLYPEDVRYALSYNDGRLGKAEIRSLLNRFQYEAVYLITKALAYAPEEQRQYLEDLTGIYYQGDYHADDLRRFLVAQIDRLPDDLQLGGAKLLQISRAGSDHWQKAFAELAQRSYAANALVLPCIVAYTPMIGYHHFIRVFGQNAPAKLQLLVPEWMLDPDDERMGYEISLGTEALVRPQVKHECLYGSWVCLHTECPMKHRFCQDAVFIDDTISTGTTANRLRSFWHSEYGLQVPQERILVITDLRHSATQSHPGNNHA